VDNFEKHESCKLRTAFSIDLKVIISKLQALAIADCRLQLRITDIVTDRVTISLVAKSLIGLEDVDSRR
jgi:hypothetical protein